MAESQTTSQIGGGNAGAILLSLIGEDEATAMVGELGPDDVGRLCGAMERLTQVDEAQIEAVLGDFIARARTLNAVATAGETPVRAAIERSLGPGRARAMMKGGADAEHPVFAQLGWLAPDDVAALVAEEHPQVAATILSRVDSGLAARALADLPDIEQADLLHRVATLAPVSNAALDDLACAIEARLAMTAETKVSVGGASAVAAILNRADRSSADRTLKSLARLDKGLATRIDNERVVFADVLGLSAKDLGTVVRAADATDLAFVLKASDAKTRDRFLAGMSQRAAQSLRDELEELSNVARSDVEAAQATLVSIARRLAQEGTLQLGAATVDYV